MRYEVSMWLHLVGVMVEAKSCSISFLTSLCIVDFYVVFVSQIIFIQDGSFLIDYLTFHVNE